MEELTFKNIKPQIKQNKYLELTNLVFSTLLNTYKIKNPFVLNYLVNKFNEQIYQHKQYNTFPRNLTLLNYTVSCPVITSDDFFLDRKNFNQITKQVFDHLGIPITNRLFINLSSVIALNYHKNLKLNYRNLSKGFLFFRQCDLDHTRLYDQLNLGAKEEVKRAA